MFRSMFTGLGPRTPASALSLVPPPADRKAPAVAGESEGGTGADSMADDDLAGGTLRERALSSGLVTSSEPVIPLAQRHVAWLAEGDASVDPSPLPPSEPTARQAYWLGIETVIDLLTDEGEDAQAGAVTTAALRDVVWRRLSPIDAGASQTIPDLWEPVFHALSQPAARNRDMRDRLTRLVRQLFGAVSALVRSPVQAQSCLAPFAGYLLAASKPARQDAWEGLRLALLDKSVPQASYLWVLVSGLSAGVSLASGRGVLMGLLNPNHLKDAASRQGLVRQVPALLEAWVQRIAAAPMLMDEEPEEGIRGVCNCLAAVAAEDDLGAQGRQAAFGRLARSLDPPTQAGSAPLRGGQLALLCRDIGEALGGTEMGAGARRDLVAFVMEVGRRDLGPAFLRIVKALVAGALSPCEVQRDAFGQPVAELDAGWAARRSLVVDTLRGLGDAGEAQLPRQALAYALAGLRAALEDGVLLHASQRQTLMALVESEVLRWPRALALVAGIGLGVTDDRLDGKSKARTGSKVHTEPATARERFEQGQRLRHDLATVFDEAGLDDDTRVFALSIGLQLTLPDLSTQALEAMSRLLQRLQGSALGPGVKARLALTAVRDMRVPPSDRHLRTARDIVLGRLGDTRLSAEPPPSWAAWQARQLTAAQSIAVSGSRTGARADAKGEQPERSWVESLDTGAGRDDAASRPVPWPSHDLIEAIAQADAYYDLVEGWLRRLKPAPTLWRPVHPVRYLEVEIDQLMRMERIPEAVRHLLVERLSIWGTEWARRAAVDAAATSQTTQGQQTSPKKPTGGANE